MERSQSTAYAGTHRVEGGRSRPSPHADHYLVCLDSSPPAIHQHLAPLPQCRDGTMGNSCQSCAAVCNSLLSIRNGRRPQREEGKCVGQQWPRSTRESPRATGITKRPCCWGNCQSGYRHVQQECNGCVCPATRLRIRFDGHFFAYGMPDRSRVVSSACGPRRDGHRTRTSVFFGILGRRAVV